MVAELSLDRFAAFGGPAEFVGDLEGGLASVGGEWAAGLVERADPDDMRAGGSTIRRANSGGLSSGSSGPMRMPTRSPASTSSSGGVEALVDAGALRLEPPADLLRIGRDAEIHPQPVEAVEEIDVARDERAARLHRQVGPAPRENWQQRAS